MSIYIALGLGGMGIKNKVTLDKDIAQLVAEAGGKSGTATIKKDSEGDLGWLLALPLSIGYKHVDGKWQIKAEVAGNIMGCMASEKSNSTVRDLGHAKVAAGYRVKDKIVVSAFAGFGVAHLTKWHVKDQDNNRFDVLKEDGKDLCGLSPEIFVGFEGQYQVCAKSYITVAVQAGLPFMNGATNDKSAFKSLEATKQFPKGLVIGKANAANYADAARNVTASLWTMRATVGFMYELGGF